jgi:ribosomal protein S13
MSTLKFLITSTEIKNQVSSLKSIFGIGKFYSKELVTRLGVSKKNLFQIKKFNLLKTRALKRYVVNFLVIENSCKRFVESRHLFFFKIKATRSLRLRWGYPIHGQRTRCNSKTSKKLNIKRLKRRI